MRVIRLKSSSAGEEVEDEDDDGEDEKDVDPATQGVAANQSNDPEDEEDNSDCPKHCLSVSSREFGVRFRPVANGLQDCASLCCKVPGREGRLPVRIK